MSDLAAGTRLGRWIIKKKLGQGSMGAVYEADDPQLGRPVALKLVLEAGPEILQRFEREIAAASAIHHANVAATVGCFPLGGRLIMVSELLPGGSLGDQVRKRGPLPWREAARLGVGIARGLEAVHEAGYVHRDLKPENVLLDAASVPKLTDFGIVRMAPGQGSIGLTRTGEILGTVEFMSPEQADDGRRVDSRSDLYSLGATLYFLVTGHAPFEGGSSLGLLRRLLTETPRSPSGLVPDLPVELERLIMELLEKNPEARPGSAAAVAERLEGLARSTKKGGAGGRALALIIIVAILAGVGAFVGARLRAPRPATPGVPPQPPTPDVLPVHWLLGEARSLPPGTSRLPVRAVAFAPLDGETVLLAGGDDRVLHVLDPRSGRERFTLEHGSAIDDVAASRTGIAVVGLVNGEAIAWSLRGRHERLGSARPAPATTNCFVAIAPEGDRAFAAGENGKFFVWDPTKGDAPGPLPLRNQQSGTIPDLGSGGGPATFLFYVDPTHVAYGTTHGQDGNVNPETGMCVGNDVRKDSPIMRGVLVRGKAEGESWFVSVTEDGYVIVQETELANALDSKQAGRKGPTRSVALLGPPGELVIAGDDGVCEEWRVEASGERVSALPGRHRVKAQARVNALAVSPAGDLLASGGEDGTVLVFELPAWSQRSFH